MKGGGAGGVVLADFTVQSARSNCAHGRLSLPRLWTLSRVGF